MKVLRLIAVAGAMAAACAPLARADSLYESSADLTAAAEGALGSDCPFTGDTGREYRLADQFTLKAASVVTGFTLGLTQTVSASGAKNGWPVDVNLSVWDVDPASGGILPGKMLFNQTLASGKLAAKQFFSSPSANRFVVSGTLSGAGFKLPAGTYYVSFFNPDCLLPTIYMSPLHLTLVQLQPKGQKAYFLGRALGFTLTGTPAP